jgi:hypothetical protein
MKIAVVAAVWLGFIVSGCVNVEAERRFSELSWADRQRYDRCRPFIEAARCEKDPDLDCLGRLRDRYAATEKDDRARKVWLLEQGCPDTVLQSEQYVK